MINYKAPIFLKTTAGKFETVFAKKSGHRDNGNGNSSNTGNIFGDPNGNSNNGKNKRKKSGY